MRSTTTHALAATVLLAGLLFCPMLATPAVAATYNGNVLAHSYAKDPPAPANAPADLSINFQMNSGANQRQWVPNPVPVNNEANWNNDQYAAGVGSWHNATSGASQAQSKAKAGLDANNAWVVDARANVRDILDGNLGNNGGDNSAHAHGHAYMGNQVIIHGPGGNPGTVDVTLYSTVYMATPSQQPGNLGSPVMMASQAVINNVPVGVQFLFSVTDDAYADYPFGLIAVIPGSVVLYDASINGSTVSQGQVMYCQGNSSPTATGSFAGATFLPWTGPGTNGEWYETGGLSSYYGSLDMTFSLPAGYYMEPVPEPATLALLGLGGLGVLGRIARRRRAA